MPWVTSSSSWIKCPLIPGSDDRTKQAAGGDKEPGCTTLGLGVGVGLSEVKEGGAFRDVASWKAGCGMG